MRQRDPELESNTPVDSRSLTPDARSGPGAPVRLDWRLPTNEIDPDALKIIGRLQRHGHEAYLVGGCVRDLLMGHRPKDFDVATSAVPEQIKSLFRNCRIIGRRFRLAHIFFGQKVIETSTFRANPKTDPNSDGPLQRPAESPVGTDNGPTGPPTEPSTDDPGEESVTQTGEFLWQDFDQAAPGPNDELLIRRDNVFGTAEQDARRRDFAINALFYNPQRGGEVIDFVGGLEDLRKRRLRTIGLPEIRFREDPIRILRAAKFAARLDLEIEPPTYDAMVMYREQIRFCAAARVLEEIARLLREGTSRRAVELLASVSVLETLLPGVAQCLEDPLRAGRLRNRLRAADELVSAGHQLSRPLCLANLLVETLGTEWMTCRDAGQHMDEHLKPRLSELNASRRDSERIKQILLAQRRLQPGAARRRTRALLDHESFPEALLFYEIGCRALLVPDMDNLKRWKDLLKDRKGPPASPRKLPHTKTSRRSGPRRARARRRTRRTGP